MMLITIDELVPTDHLLRKINNPINFSFINPSFKDYYCHKMGEPVLNQCCYRRWCLSNIFLKLKVLDKPVRILYCTKYEKESLNNGKKDKLSRKLSENGSFRLISTQLTLFMDF